MPYYIAAILETPAKKMQPVFNQIKEKNHLELEGHSFRIYLLSRIGSEEIPIFKAFFLEREREKAKVVLVNLNVQSNSVITNSLGPAESVRYNRVSL